MFHDRFLHPGPRGLIEAVLSQFQPPPTSLLSFSLSPQSCQHLYWIPSLSLSLSLSVSLSPPLSHGDRWCRQKEGLNLDVEWILDASVTDYSGNRHPGQILTRITIIFSNGSGSAGGRSAWTMVNKGTGGPAIAHIHTSTHQVLLSQLCVGSNMVFAFIVIFFLPNVLTSAYFYNKFCVKIVK